MMRKRTTYYILFFVSALLLTTAKLVGAQEMPTTIEITWVDTSQYPNIEVYTDPRAADGSQQTGLFLFADRAGLLTEDGADRTVAGIYDTPQGTWLTFLIAADTVAETNWDVIEQAITSYAQDPYMDEDWDYVSLIVTDGDVREVLVEQSQFRNEVLNAFVTAEGARYKPPIAAEIPLTDLIDQTLTGLAGPSPKEGMYRAIVLFSSGVLGASQRSIEEVGVSAKQNGIPLHTVLVGQDPTGADNMARLARTSGGSTYGLDASADLTKLWQLVSSHRQQYVISYRSQITASGRHTVKVQLSETVADALDFAITVEPPQVEISLPTANQVISRRPVAPGDPLASHEPKTQAVKYLWSWPDGHERQVNTVQLRVNGAVVQVLDLTTSDDRNLVWDITNMGAGPYSLRVEVIDEMGLQGASAEVPVTIEIASPTPSSPAPTATKAPRKASSPSLLKTLKRNLGLGAVSGLGLAALVATLFAFRRRAGAAAKSPITFLRRLPMFRPLDSMLRSVERVAGPIRLKKPKASAAAAKAAVKKEPTAWVEVVEGQTTARSPIQVEAETGFGRSAEHAKIVFADKTVSRLHARIVPEHGGKYRVYNQSTQNTWVNEQRVPEHGLLLQDGDVIRMGQVRLRFRTKQR